VDAELVNRFSNSLCSCCYYSCRGINQTAVDDSARFRCKSKTDTKIDFSITEVRTSVQQFLNFRSNIKIEAESRSTAPASIRNQFPFCVLVLLLHVTVKPKKLCAFVSKDSKSFTSSREKEIGWWIIATCTRRRTRKAPRSTLDTHKQRMRVRQLTVKFRQRSHEFTFGVGMTFVSYPLVLTPVV
jgi:hypothetical protein